VGPGLKTVFCGHPAKQTKIREIDRAKVHTPVRGVPDGGVETALDVADVAVIQQKPS
jgi:hypothetical protein